MLKKIILTTLAVTGLVGTGLKNSYAQSKLEEPLSKIVRVIDSITKEPLPGANILLGQSQGISTDINGYALIKSQTDTTYTLNVTYLGYGAETTQINLEKKSSNDNDIIMINMVPQAILSEEIMISAKKEESLQGVLNDAEKINKESLQSTNLISGNSLTDKIFAQTTGFSATSGKEFFYSSAREDLFINWNGIERTIQGLFGYDAIMSQENSEFEIYPFAAPSEKPKGLIGIISTKTLKPKQNELRVNASVDHLRTSTNMNGKIPFLDETWYSINGEWNIASLWKIKNLNPRKNEYSLTLSTTEGKHNISVSALFVNSSITLKGKQYEPSQTDIQSAGSISYETVTNKMKIDLLYALNFIGSKNSFKDLGDANYDKTSHSLKLELTRENNLGIFISGMDAFFTKYYQSIYVVKNENSLKNMSLQLINEVNNFSIVPVYFYAKQEIKINKKTAAALGLTILADMMYLNKEIAVAPYTKLMTELMGINASITYSLRLNDVDFRQFSEELSVGEYEKSKFPKSHQLSLELEKAPFGVRFSYYKFYDQNKNDININPFQRAFNQISSDVNSDSLKAAILFANPELLLDEEGMQNLDSLVNSLPQAKEQINSELEIYGSNYITNKNRNGFALDAWIRTQNIYFSATFSKTTEMSSSTPYINDINLILKTHMHKDFEVLGEQFNAAIYIEYMTGRPYTPLVVMPSLAEEKNLTEQIDLYKDLLPKEYVDLLTKKRQIPEKRNSSRYPYNLISSISLTKKMNIFGMDISVSAYALDLHLLIPGMKKNIQQIYYVTDGNDNLVLKQGEALGILGGFSIKMGL